MSGVVAETSTQAEFKPVQRSRVRELIRIGECAIWGRPLEYACCNSDVMACRAGCLLVCGCAVTAGKVGPPPPERSVLVPNVGVWVQPVSVSEVGRRTQAFNVAALIRALKCELDKRPGLKGKDGTKLSARDMPFEELAKVEFVQGFTGLFGGKLRVPGTMKGLAWLQQTVAFPEAGADFLQFVSHLVVYSPAHVPTDWLAVVAMVRMFPRLLHVAIYNVYFGTRGLAALLYTPNGGSVAGPPVIPWASLELVNNGLDSVAPVVAAAARGLLPRLDQLIFRKQCTGLWDVMDVLREARTGGALAALTGLVFQDCAPAPPTCDIREWFHRMRHVSAAAGGGTQDAVSPCGRESPQGGSPVRGSPEGCGLPGLLGAFVGSRGVLPSTSMKLSKRGDPLPGLGVLKVANCRLTDESLDVLLPLVPEGLKHLLVDFNAFTAAGLHRLDEFCEKRKDMALSKKGAPKSAGDTFE